MRVGVNVPGHRGAWREGVDLDVHFPAWLAGKIGDEKLLGLDLSGSLSLALDEQRKTDHACHHKRGDEGLCWHHGWGLLKQASPLALA